ncbi:MAG: GNAT family N-acetyltransferase [Oscillospiraceae bacterium]|nr:GNAT family N-acetyltransferase [Oscillospiraceae bacterium]
MSITYKNTVSAEEVNLLRKAVGFRQILPEQIRAGLDGSALVVSAYDCSRIVGMARLIWDGGMVALITDVLVLPEYKTQGVEQELITRLLDFLRSKLKPGFGIQVDIKVWDNREAFYESLGFQLSTPERRGTPMHICLTNQIELTDAEFKQCAFRGKEEKSK